MSKEIDELVSLIDMLLDEKPTNYKSELRGHGDCLDKILQHIVNYGKIELGTDESKKLITIYKRLT